VSDDGYIRWAEPGSDAPAGMRELLIAAGDPPPRPKEDQARMEAEFLRRVRAHDEREEAKAKTRARVVRYVGIPLALAAAFALVYAVAPPPGPAVASAVRFVRSLWAPEPKPPESDGPHGLAGTAGWPNAPPADAGVDGATPGH
jgi:hypothetical protein